MMLRQIFGSSQGQAPPEQEQHQQATDGNMSDSSRDFNNNDMLEKSRATTPRLRFRRPFTNNDRRSSDEDTAAESEVTDTDGRTEEEKSEGEYSEAAASSASETESESELSGVEDKEGDNVKEIRNGVVCMKQSNLKTGTDAALMALEDEKTAEEVEKFVKQQEEEDEAGGEGEGDGNNTRKRVKCQNPNKANSTSISNTSITGAGRSIEIFFGDFTNFGNFYQVLSEEDQNANAACKETLDILNNNENVQPSPIISSTTSTDTPSGKKRRGKSGEPVVRETVREPEPAPERFPSKFSSVNPLLVKKLCLIGHPLESFHGINNFKRLLEAWVTNCTIKELRRTDLQGLQYLIRLYAFGCSLEKVDPLHLDNLKILWLSGNRLTSLSFLNHGLPSLQELNVANNEISCLSAESLFKCMSLENLNVAGNPLCTIQDIKDANACAKLKDLTLVDAMYGKCPVACLCDSRPMIVSAIKNISILNGKRITDDEIKITNEYIKDRCLYYYSNSISSKSNHVALRNSTIASVYKQLESIGERIMNLLTFVAQTDYQLSNSPAFTRSKTMVKDEMQKVHRRIADLRMWAVVTIERFETVIHINRWEQEIEEWLKWIEYQSYGSIQGYLAHSVLDLTASKDTDNIRSTVHQLISSLSCSKPWPEDTVLKVETITVIRDRGAELGMEKTYNIYFSQGDEPPFIPPPPESPPVDPPTMSNHPVIPPFSQYKFVPTYTDPQYKPPNPMFPFPESVSGLPERSHPCFMFLVCDSLVENNPVLYLYNLLTDKSENFQLSYLRQTFVTQTIRLTNCLWNAIEAIKFSDPHAHSTTDGPNATTGKARSSGNTRVPRTNDVGANPFSVVVVMKVLEECLVTVPMSSEKCRKHSNDCLTFGVSRPLSYAPAYIISVSHSYNDRDAIWVRGITDDFEVRKGVENLYLEAITKGTPLGNTAKQTQSRRIQPYYLHKCGHGMKADLTAITKLVQDPTPPSKDETTEKDFVEQHQKTLTRLKASVDLLRISKFLGQEIAHTVTTLDLSGNGLGLTVGLEGMNNLRRLNLSHNNLTTLSGLHKLPHLIELKASWNYLRFLHSSISTLTWATPRLITLEILPNPFQDVRDYAHIPLLVSQALPLLHRVDIWSAPFATTSKMSHNCFLSTTEVDIEGGFSYAILADSWVQGHSYSYKEFRGKCLTNLDQLPRTPPFPEGYSISAISLDLSDNYLSSTALGVANFVRTSEWRAAVVKLNLQENCITSLDWLKDNIFPNLHILNLSNNHLQELDMIQFACPSLTHLHLSGNPLPCSTYILAPLRHLLHLQHLEATRTPLSSHPDYGNYVIRYIPKIQILDGVPVANWRSEEIVNHMGGTLNTEWLELNLGQRDWSSLTELSLPHCGLSRVNLPSNAVPKLMSLDLTGNHLSTFSGITSLPNLRVLCVSYNSIKSLGSFPCPKCYAHTAESRAQFQKNKSCIASVSSADGKFVKKKKAKGDSKRPSSSTMRDWLSTSPKGSQPTKDPPKVFPRLEVLIMSHNSLSGLNDLHLHCLPRLQTLMLNCNQIASFKGLDKLSSLQAIVLDHNQIKDIPFNTFVGCKCLKYLHLEHNRIASLPRLPHLNNLASLHLGYNRIQTLTDINCLTTNGIKELTLVGNPAAYRGDYMKKVSNQVNTLHKLDGIDIRNYLTSLKGDLAALKFAIPEPISIKTKAKAKGSIMLVPHGKLHCRPLNDFDDKQELDDEYENYTDITE